jgi:hypothetical protein
MQALLVCLAKTGEPGLGPGRAAPKAAVLPITPLPNGPLSGPDDVISSLGTRSASAVRQRDYWQVVVVLLPVPGGVHSVSREMCQPEFEMSNR